MCTLEEGDVYGMTSLFVVDGELETSLVSRGCECVIVKKDTFQLLLNKPCKDNIKEKVRSCRVFADKCMKWRVMELRS